MTKLAICILTRGYKHKYEYIDIILRNRALSNILKNESKLLHVDYKIFHEGNITEAHQHFINKYSNLKNLEFINVSKEFDREIKANSKYTCKTKLSESFTQGYKSMCRFWTDRFFEYTKTYDFVARIDEDCIIKKIPIMQIIDYMINNNVNYITPLNFEKDDPQVTVGLLDFTDEFIKKHNIKCNNKITLNNNPYTNMFLLNSNHYQNLEILRNFMSEVQYSNGIDVNRWGDHVIWGLIFKILGEDQSKMIRKDIQYIHGSFGEVVNRRPSIINLIEILSIKLIKIVIKKINRIL